MAFLKIVVIFRFRACCGSLLDNITIMLIAEPFRYEIPKGYAYFAVAFFLAIEMLNLRYDENTDPVKLKKRIDSGYSRP